MNVLRSVKGDLGLKMLGSRASHFYEEQMGQSTEIRRTYIFLRKASPQLWRIGVNKIISRANMK
jgi:hypothetical protein